MGLPDDLAKTLPATWAKTLEENWDALAGTIERASGTIVPGPRSHDTRGAAAVGRLPERDMGESLEVGRTLGEGGMGIVRLATQRSLGRKVAVKTLRPAANLEQARLSLLREAWITGAIEHPNVVPIYDLGLDDERNPVIVLKHIEGRTWDSLMTDEGAIKALLPYRDLLESNLRVLIGVCHALAAAHARGVIHRDMKPENVMIGPHGEVYVLDWGIAVSLIDDETGRFPLARDAVEMAGTPSYMAPEMLGGAASRVSEQTDVYLLGATLYQIVLGRPPHEHATFREVVESILRPEPLLEGAPDELLRIIRRAMNRDPALRHASVDELRRDVEAFLLHRDSLVLSEEALAREAEIVSLLAEAGDPAKARPTLHRLYGACRSCFKEALRAWPGNEDARIGLNRAAERMIRFEVAAKAAEAAEAILADLDLPPAELVQMIEASKKEDAALRARVAALENRFDAITGGRTRAVVGSLLGLTFVATPLVGWWLEPPTGLTYGLLAGAIGADLLVFGLLFAWARDSLTKTGVNRGITYTIFGMLVSTATFVGIAYLLGLPPVTTCILFQMIWFTVAVQYIGIQGPRVVAIVLANLGSLLASSRWSQYRFLFMALSNSVFTGNVLFLWGSHLQPKEEEREKYRRWKEERRRARPR